MGVRQASGFSPAHAPILLSGKKGHEFKSIPHKQPRANFTLHNNK